MKRISILLLCVSVLCLGILLPAGADNSPKKAALMSDTILINGKIITVDPDDLGR